MSQPKRLSRQELIRQRQSSSFVGRVEQLEAFKHNLANLSTGSDGIAYPTAFLFNIWGQGGVGKSSLLRQFEDIAKQQKHLVSRIDEGITTAPEAMATFAKQLAAQGQPLTKFSERYKVYRQKQKELETDPDAPQGFSAFVGQTAAKVSLKLGRKIPMSDVALDLVDEASVIEGAGEWATYVARKLKNKDEIQLVNEPIDVLTPLFLEDLGNITTQQVVLQFDTYERTEEILDFWLLDILKDRYGILPSNCIWTIAGREQLGANSWSGYEPVQFPLKAFSVEEAIQFLQRWGVTNAEVIEAILDVSGRLPLLLAILAKSSPNSPTQVGEASGTAVERFLQWIDDPKRRQVALDAAWPRSLNRDVIAILHGEELADELFNWLKQMPFVENLSNGWAYHDIARTQMLRHKRLVSPQSWIALHTQLEDYYSQLQKAFSLPGNQLKEDPKWQEYTLNIQYHNLCKMPQQHLGIALNMFLSAYSYSRLFSLSQAQILCQAGKDTEIDTLKSWGERLIECVGRRYMGQDKNRVFASVFTDLLKHPDLDTKWKSLILSSRGDAYRLLQQSEEALRDLNESLNDNTIKPLRILVMLWHGTGSV